MSIEVILCAAFLWGGFGLMIYREWKIEMRGDKK